MKREKKIAEIIDSLANEHKATCTLCEKRFDEGTVRMALEDNLCQECKDSSINRCNIYECKELCMKKGSCSDCYFIWRKKRKEFLDGKRCANDV